MRTVMDRMREKLHQASMISKGLVSCKIMPVLGFETFLSALKDLSIFHCMSDFEADEAMVALAKAASAGWTTSIINTSGQILRAESSSDVNCTTFRPFAVITPVFNPLCFRSSLR